MGKIGIGRIGMDVCVLGSKYASVPTVWHTSSDVQGCVCVSVTTCVCTYVVHFLGSVF